MQSQQHVSVWPYIEWLPSWGHDGLYLDVTNKGIGPAIVKDVTIRLDNVEYESFKSLFESIEDSVGIEFGYSTVRNRVIAPNENIRAFIINDQEIGDWVKEKFSKSNFEYEICYCSVYGDCWTSMGTVVVEDKCK